jgi:replicative DNA helicase
VSAPESDELPAVVEAERSVLAAMILDEGAIPRARALLDAATFCIDRHALVFKAVCSLDERGEAVDLIALCAELDRTGELEAVGGPGAVAHIMEYAVTSANLGPHGAIVIEAHARRTLRRLALDLQTRAEDPTTEPRDLVAGLKRLCATLQATLARAEVARCAR